MFEERVRRVVMVALVGAVFFTVIHAARGRVISTVNDAVLVCALSSMLLSGYPTNPKARAHLLLACTWVAMFVLSWVSGQGEAAALWWFASLPLAAAYLLDRFDTWVWVVLSVVAVFLNAAGSAWMPYEPEFLVDATQRVISQVTRRFASWPTRPCPRSTARETTP